MTLRSPRPAGRALASRATVALALLAAVSFAERVAFAQSAADKHAQAEDAFRRGREAQSKGDCRSGLQLFRSSQALEPGRGKVLNMALCEQELGMLAKAEKHFQALLPQLPADDDRVPIVKAHIAELGPRVPHLRFDLGTLSPAATRVQIDDEIVAASELSGEIAVDVGAHRVKVTVDGRPDTELAVDTPERAHRTVRVDGGSATPPVDRPADAPSVVRVVPTTGEAEPHGSGMGTRRLAGFVVGGIGVAGLLVGAGTGIRALQDHGSVTSGCPTRVGCSSSVVSEASQGKALSIASTAAFVVGAVAVGAGAFLVFTRGTDARNATAFVSVEPGGLRVGGSF